MKSNNKTCVQLYKIKDKFSLEFFKSDFLVVLKTLKF